ncbi:hypothetical protein BDR26DRAFT_862850 [Obelidium mucronatum]|nr:hypothetical protein BDR26DRAFT_862850 [Obelidium mucronatum]
MESWINPPGKLDPTEPKRPDSPFILYVKHCNVLMPQDTDPKKVLETFDRIQDEWKLLPLAAKEVFYLQAKKLELAYTIELMKHKLNKGTDSSRRKYWEKKLAEAEQEQWRAQVEKLDKALLEKRKKNASRKNDIPKTMRNA